MARDAAVHSARGTTIKRWLWILALAAIGAVQFEVLLPVGWAFFREFQIPDTIPGWAVWLSACLYTFVLLVVFLDPLRISPGQFRFALRYPPLWMAVVLSFVLVSVRRLLLPELGPNVLAPQHLPPSVVIVLAGLALLAIVRRARFQTGQVSESVQASTVGDLTWEEIEAWSAREEPGRDEDPDLFGHTSVVSRLVGRLNAQGDCEAIALVGAYGSGKSTILKRVATRLRTNTDPYVFHCTISCWGFSDSATVALHVTDRLVSSLWTFTDATTIQGLPASYRRMLRGDRLSVFERVIGSEESRDVTTRFQELPPILNALNARLVLFIEDADRPSGAGFEPGQLERLLWTIKRLPNVTFVLALDKDQLNFDLSKLCEHIELLATLDTDSVADLVGTVRSHCLNDYTFVEPSWPTQRKDPLELERPAGSLAAYVRLTLPPETVPARTLEFGRNDQEAGCHARATAQSKSSPNCAKPRWS